MQPTPVLQRAVRRLALTTKQGPHNYYKGNRTGSMGTINKWGNHKIDYRKVRTYVCPDLTDFDLTPFVATRITSKPDDFRHTETKNAMDGKEYIRKWKAAGGNM